MKNQEVGNFIYQLRTEKKLTQEGVAKLLGVTDKAVSKWERGIGYPDIEMLKKISEINTEIRFLKIKHRIELEKILTKSQLTRLKEEKRHMRRKMKRGQFNGE